MNFRYAQLYHSGHGQWHPLPRVFGYAVAVFALAAAAYLAYSVL